MLKPLKNPPFLAVDITTLNPPLETTRLTLSGHMSNVCKLWRLWSIGVGWVLQFYFRASSKDLVPIFHSTIQESLTWSKLVQTLNRQNIKLTRKITAGSKSHHLAMMMTMIMMLMDDEWWVMDDEWWLMNGEWWMMDDQWSMINDESLWMFMNVYE